MSYPDILHYCSECEKETTHFNVPSLLTDNAFECVDCENTIILAEGTEVVFLHYDNEEGKEEEKAP